MNLIRLKKDKDGKAKTRYSEGFFGGLFGQGLWVDTAQLRQRFKGEIPAEIEIEIRAVEHDEPREDVDRRLRNRSIQEKRLATQKDKEESGQILEGMHVREALERLEKKFGKGS